MAELREALAVSDAAAAVHLAHNVRGTSASYGAPRLAGLCGELEQAALASDVAASSALLAGVNEEFARVRACAATAVPGTRRLTGGAYDGGTRRGAAGAPGGRAVRRNG
jgi:HPt (histidine-containing phosphotransfer) domain-containing protein